MARAGRQREISVVFWTMLLVAVSFCVVRVYVFLLVPTDLRGAVGWHAGVLVSGLSGLFGYLAIRHLVHTSASHEALRRSADIDELTGALTRRRFFSEVRKIDIEKAVVMMVDIDHFKSINDTLGHQAGDKVLVHTGQLLCSALRGSDIVGRYGGEEFAIVLPSTSIEVGERIAERLRSRVETSNIQTDGGRVNLTISLGLAGGVRGLGIDTLIALADAALLSAKNEGRNRCIVNRTGAMPGEVMWLGAAEITPA